MTRKYWETLAALAIGTSALAIAVGVLVPGVRGQQPDPVDCCIDEPIASLETPEEQAKQPRIEVVFALDTTGSMGGLLDGAKQKVWSIANKLASGDPRPDIRVGLVAYRDVGDAYVTRRTPLTGDLDEIYGALFQYRAEGGGDGPEHVNAALSSAIHQTAWSQDDDVLRLVFLVGDAPPHNDYDDGLNTQTLTKEARDRNIVVNTIRCGTDEQTESVWKMIAAATGGEFASVEQSGGVKVTNTPFDDELMRLNAELADTVVGFGTAAEQQAAIEKTTRRKRMAAPAAAAAASFAAKTKTMNREDLVSAIEGGAVRLDEIQPEALPDNLRSLSKDEQRREIERISDRRSAINKQILEVSKQRDGYLKKNSDESGFDGEVLDMVREQSSKIGVVYH